MARPSAQQTMSAPPISPGKTARRSDHFLGGLRTADRVVFVSHLQPDPDSLGSMWGLSHLVAERIGIPAVLTQDGGIFRAENRAMVDLLKLDLQPVGEFVRQPGDAVVMVDSQPGTGRHTLGRIGAVSAVVDHHVTPGDLSGVAFADVQPNLGATCTIVSQYLNEQKVKIPDKLATALLYGIETELSGFPREGTAADDDAIALLYPLADKDLLARIRYARLPKSHFEVLAQALRNAQVFDRLVFTWVDPLGQPEQAAEVVDFLIRYDNVDWAVCAGVHNNKVVLSARAARANAKAGELLREALNGLGNAGGHERRAGGCITITDATPSALERLRGDVTRRVARAFGYQVHSPLPLVPTGPSRSDTW
jgi:nanoRNase/pAp phosphatase (c-di-AMP/oligoRNAs hydrolase)